uniref:UDP-glycosyltransferase 71E1 n=1 Tax=Stevia rebaudiana TaxID=55670 RepID=U71E1_STERE|nr:RecName: Full=UDP-glycosyltransferase 71E1 [Stevia rebaudiana]AAR06914.1 UDP-glycosyltransferase 71E1 [Stevia rebaudiana]
MSTSELVFIPSPGAGHLPPTVELAKLLLHRDQRLSVTIIVMNLWLGPKHNTEARPCVPSLRFVDIPCDESTMALISPNTFISAFVEHHKPRVRDIVRGIIESDSVRLAGFVLDMFCMPMSDVANEFGVPSYNYFTSGAATLGLMFHLQWKRDHEGYDATELKNSDTELSVPSYVNPVPAKVLPEVVLDKEGGSKMFLDLAERIRESKGIIVNSCQAIERHALEYLSSNNNGIPPVFPVGPILNLENKKDDAKTDEIMRWLNEQPESSVVFLCFGSMGSFNEKQVKEIAVAIERSGHRFLWSLRRPTPKEKIEFPKEYENLEEVLPEGFLKRTSSIGKVIGWAPQMAVLSHPSVGGFVSHCGWNSTLESMWCGVPMAAWPLYAEQTLNAFLLVVELGLAAEIRMDYRTDTKAGYDGGMEVTVEEIEDGIRKLMSDGEIRNKVKDVKEKSRAAVVEGGSSYASIGKFIEHVSNVTI